MLFIHISKYNLSKRGRVLIAATIPAHFLSRIAFTEKKNKPGKTNDNDSVPGSLGTGFHVMDID